MTALERILVADRVLLAVLLLFPCTRILRFFHEMKGGNQIERGAVLETLGGAQAATVARRLPGDRLELCQTSRGRGGGGIFVTRCDWEGGRGGCFCPPPNVPHTQGGKRRTFCRSLAGAPAPPWNSGTVEQNWSRYSVKVCGEGAG